MTAARESLFPLVRIEHSRCGEWDGAEYVLAPPGFSEAQIRAEVSAVVHEMIEDAKAVKDAALRPPPHPPYADHPDKKVSEVQALHEEQKLAYKRWLEENTHLTRYFLDRLVERGFVRLWDDEPQTGRIDVTAQWGHNHGLILNYEHEHHA